MMKIKVHWKLTFIFCLAVIFGLLAGYFYLKTLLTQSFENNLKTSISYRLLLGKNFLESQLDAKNNLPDPVALADKIGKQQDLRTTIIAMDGTVLGDSYLNVREIKRLENHLHRPEIQQAIKNDFGSSTRFSHTIGKYLLYMSVVFGKDKPAGILRYAVPVSYIEILEGGQDKIIIGTLVLVFLLSLGFTFTISLVVSRPLVEMASIAQAMAKGDFSKKPNVYANDELGDMARTLSYMSAEIKDKIESIKQENLKLDVILSSMSEGVMVVDEKGHIILMNVSLRKMFFIDFDPEKRASIEAIRNPQIYDFVNSIIKKGKKFISGEVDISHPEEKILKVNAVPIIKNDVLRGAVLVFHDVTAIRKLEKVRQEFVANVSHELRTPMTSIKGYSETLLEGAIEDKDNAKKFINIIHQNSVRLISLIDDLMDLAMIESNKMKINLTPLEIKPILDRCLGVINKSIKDKQLSIIIHIPDDLPKILADDRRLAQVFLNLLDNAVKYTPNGGSITVNAFLNDKFVQVDISDTGMGIPENDLPRIFERFYRVDKARSRDLGGTGLGLSIVKNIVLSHNGQVWVKSQLEQGSTFSFTIPHS